MQVQCFLPLADLVLPSPSNTLVEIFCKGSRVVVTFCQINIMSKLDRNIINEKYNQCFTYIDMTNLRIVGLGPTSGEAVV